MFSPSIAMPWSRMPAETEVGCSTFFSGTDKFSSPKMFQHIPVRQIHESGAALPAELVPRLTVVLCNIVEQTGLQLVLSLQTDRQTDGSGGSVEH